jgi:hypothetical protein
MITTLTPGDDYYAAVQRVFYYRDCVKKKLVRQMATFHFVIPNDHLPKNGTLSQVAPMRKNYAYSSL